MTRSASHLPGLMATLHEQFGHPRGVIGSLVGHLMALKNAARSRWALQLLTARPGERLLEIGFGSGADVRRLASIVAPGGSVAGVDVSSAMLRQATRRNRRSVASGRVALQLGRADALPFPDAAYSINCAQFWPELATDFRELFRVVRPGGRLLIAVQPMHRSATSADSERWALELLAAARQAGWAGARKRLGPTLPPVAAVTATKPES